MKTQDKRRDSGEYYPGGRVIARPGTAPQQVVVQWSDVQNKPQIAPLPERYRDSDVKTKINEITSKFATVVMAALLGWTALGGVTVHTARKDQIYNDEPVVTNVTYSAEAETDPTVPAWAKAAEPPQTMTTNAVRDIIHATVDGAARPLPRYLHVYEAADSYPAEAEEYYRSRGDGKTDGGCSAVRSGGFLYRNFDFPFDERAEFVVKMSAGKDRFASVGVAQVGTNLTEQMVTSGKWSKWYKSLPGATVDGINENGVACNINVTGGTPRWNTYETDNPIHPLAVVRWVLDNATNAEGAASFVAKNVRFPPGWKQNFHYMIADERETWIVENGVRISDTSPRAVLTNFNVGPFGDQDGDGVERYDLLLDGANITNAWYTRAYHRSTTPPWISDLAEVIAYTNEIFDAWAAHPKEYFRGKTNNGIPWWQSVHTSIYDLTNRTLCVAVQETNDWYVFAVPSAGGVKPEAVREIVQPMIEEAVEDRVRFENLATEWVAGESYTNGQPVFVKVCLTAQKNIFICVKAHDGEDAVNFDDTDYWCPIQDYRFASQGDIPAPYVPSADDPIFSSEVNAVTEATIRREVSAALNTYVDGETGVEYVGKFYGGSLYYVPTGNVYPPNNRKE